MNGIQKVVLTIGFVLILATGIYPPWVQSWQFVTGGEDVWHRIEAGAEGYSWIFRPPGTPSWVDTSFLKPDAPELTIGMIKVLSSIRMPGTWRAQIDIRRLLIEWAIIAAGVLTGILGSVQKSDLRNPR